MKKTAFTAAFAASLIGATTLLAQTDATVANPEPAAAAAEPAAAALLVEVPAFKIEPYGWIKFDAVYDSARTAYGDISFFVMPDAAPGGGKRELTFAARDFRFGAHIIAPEQHGIKVRGRIEGDWCDDLAPNAYKPRLRLAYVDLDFGCGWIVTAGQAWDTYNSNGIFPETLDPGNLAFTGNPYGRHPLLRVSKKIGLGGENALTAKLAVQSGRNAADYDKDGQSDENASGVPNVHASLALTAKLFADAPPATFAVSGAYGQEKVRSVFDADSGAVIIPAKTYDSTLLHLAAKIPLCERFAIQGVAFAGDNLDNYLAGVGQGVNPATGEEIFTVGGYVNCIYAKKDGNGKNIYLFSVGYGIDDPDDKHLPVGGRTKNERAFLTASYNLTKELSIWGEYSYMRTTFATPDGTDTADNNRFHFAVKYAF